MSAAVQLHMASKPRLARIGMFILASGLFAACSPQSGEQNVDTAEVGWDALLEGVVEQRDGCFEVDGFVLVLRDQDGPEFGIGDWVSLGGGYGAPTNVELNCDASNEVFFVDNINLVRTDGSAP